MSTKRVDVITLTVEPVNSKAGQQYVIISVNGRPLTELVREVELPFATREGHPDMAGDYRGLPPREAFLPSRHLLGEPKPLWSGGDDRVIALRCECGEPGCWPLYVRITVGEGTVTWSDFEQPHRGENSAASHWRYDRLAPFVFVRQQYETALAGANSENRTER